MIVHVFTDEGVRVTPPVGIVFVDASELPKIGDAITTALGQPTYKIMNRIWTKVGLDIVVYLSVTFFTSSTADLGLV